MQTVLIVIHLMIVLALVVVVLLQRSEGGALGIGGGGGFMSGRGQSNPLTRLTAYLAAAFFATSLALTIIAGYGGGSVFDRLQPSESTRQQPAAPAGPTAPLGTGQGGILPSLKPAGQQQGGGAGAPPQPEAPQGAQQPTFEAPPAAQAPAPSESGAAPQSSAPAEPPAAAPQPAAPAEQQAPKQP